jgi:hypothetical protein
MAPLTLARRIIAMLGALGAAVCMRSWDHQLPAALWLPTGLLALSGLLLWRRSVGGQLLARAVWWSNLILGTLIATTGSSSERGIAALLALCTGGALIAVGRADLDETTPSGTFLPLAFRGTLICMLVMAMADAQSLLLFGALEVTEPRQHYLAHTLSREALPLVLALPLLLSVIGLYRLRLWGLLLNLAASLTLALASLTEVLELPRPLRIAYVVTATAQWLVSLPLLLALIRHRAPAERPSLEQRGYAATVLLVGAMVTLSLVCSFVMHARLIEP